MVASVHAWAKRLLKGEIEKRGIPKGRPYPLTLCGDILKLGGEAVFRELGIVESRSSAA